MIRSKLRFGVWRLNCLQNCMWLLVIRVVRKASYLMRSALFMTVRLSVSTSSGAPNYPVFDEKRYFAEGQDACVVDVAGIKVGVTICEDIWHKEPADRQRALVLSYSSI